MKTMTVQQAQDIIRNIFGSVRDASFRVRFWDGSEQVIGNHPAFTLVFRDEATFSELFRTQDVFKFTEAFVEDRFDIEGDFEAALRLKSQLRDAPLSWQRKLLIAWRLGLGIRHNRKEDQKNVQAHYDVSNDFYKLFLDTHVMAYSCAYYHHPDESLEQAQEHKVDLICRKLRLKPGEKLLDIGSGWGGLLIHAAKHYGVIGHGVTLSQNQYDLARQRIAAAGLSDKITIELRDYRDLADASFDKISSVGMYEHVGIRRYPEYFGAVYRLLKPGGLFLNHGITNHKHSKQSGETTFMVTYIFPNGELDNISHTQSVMEDEGFEILNMECLRPHYAKTLREWSRRLTTNEEKALQMVPKSIYRAWKMYLAGLPLAFDDGGVSICQVLASKNPGVPSKTPMTPHDIYS